VKNYENRSIFARVITKINVSRFFMAHSVYLPELTATVCVPTHHGITSL